MERVEKHGAKVVKALKTLSEAIILWKSDGVSGGVVNSSAPIKRALRDSLIQRFEYSVDAFWKFMKLYMDINAANPRAIVQVAYDNGLVLQQELGLLMDAISDRNLTSHTYNEELAEEIAHRIPDHYEILSTVIARLKVE